MSVHERDLPFANYVEFSADAVASYQDLYIAMLHRANSGGGVPLHTSLEFDESSDEWILTAVIDGEYDAVMVKS